MYFLFTALLFGPICVMGALRTSDRVVRSYLAVFTITSIALTLVACLLGQGPLWLVFVELALDLLALGIGPRFAFSNQIGDEVVEFLVWLLKRNRS